MNRELHATEVTVAGVVEDRAAAEALLNEISKDSITGKAMGKARAKGKGSRKQSTSLHPGHRCQAASVGSHRR